MEKPNCYKCKYRRPLPGDCHSKCVHPILGKVHDDPMAQLISMSGGLPPIFPEILGITAHEHGIRSGWFTWPLNFDPAWMITCDGYETNTEDN